MIKVLRTNGVLQIAIIAIAVVAIWVGWFVEPEVMTDRGDGGPLYILIKNTLGSNGIVSVIIALILTLTEGYLLNRLLYERGLIPLNTLMPMLLYMLVMGIGANGCRLTPELITNMWVILALWSVMPKEGVIKTEGSIFNSGLLCGMTALTWTPGVVVIVPITIGQIIYKMYQGREWAVGILGLFAPIIIVLTTAFLIDDWEMIVSYTETVANGLGLRESVRWDSILETTVLGLFAMVTTVGTLTMLERKTIAQRTHGLVIVTVFIYSLATLFYESLMPVDAEPFAVVVAAMGSIYFMEKKKHLWIYDIMIGLLFLTSMLNYLPKH